ncbi:MAG: hypothetical protein AB7Q23_05745 [Hyphomonadaceae bacterium]
MRSLIRAALLGSALVTGAVGVASCQRQSTQQDEAATGPSIEERQAEIAAEQLAALGGPANAEQRALYEGEFQASGGIDALGSGEGGGEGAEGAWELRLLEDYAQFARPGLDDGGGIPGERDYRERGMRVVAGDVIVTITHEPCTASGIQLPYVAHVLFEGVAYQGCARRGIEEGERPTWASVLPELIPAIDVCLARATSRPARVTFASAVEDGAVMVRLRQANGARHECRVGGEAVVFETLGDLDRRPGEGDLEFQRGNPQPRAETCRSAQPAVSRGGEHLGWLIRRSC